MYKSKTSLLKSNVAVHPFKPVLAVIVPVVAPAEPESNAIISMSPLPASADEGTVIFETTWQLYCVRKDGRWDAYGLGSGVGGWTNPR